MADSQVVTVRAQWAIRGWSAQAHAYRVLDCSTGALSNQNFAQLLDRYSPGTLESLPQLTVGWLADKNADRHYLGLALHGRDSDGPAVGSDLMHRTTYFFVDFSDFAGVAAPYAALYYGFADLAMPPTGQGSVRATVSVPKLETPKSRLARAAAALLLTDRPVGILGADQVDFAERLKFLDDVMSLLPYGMRSRMSASTWTSSTYKSHKIRLFFASADRQAGDHELYWDSEDTPATGIDLVDAYRAWLDEHGRAAQLAAITEPTGFGRREVTSMLRRIGLLTARRQTARPGASGSASVSGPISGSTTTPTSTSSTSEGSIPSLSELIIQCADLLTSKHPESVGVNVERIKHHPANPPTELERSRYRQLIKDYQLLRGGLPLRYPLRNDFFEMLLGIGFGDPLSYEDYCFLEDCAAPASGKSMHRALARVIIRVMSLDFVVALLVHEVVAPAYAAPKLTGSGLTPELVIAMAADEALRPHHARTICGLVMPYLEEQAAGIDKAALRSALDEHGYLAPALDRCYPDQVEAQAAKLTTLLGAVYSDGFDSQVMRDILNSPKHPATPALVSAIGAMIRYRRS